MTEGSINTGLYKKQGGNPPGVEDSTCTHSLESYGDSVGGVWSGAPLGTGFIPLHPG